MNARKPVTSQTGIRVDRRAKAISIDCRSIPLTKHALAEIYDRYNMDIFRYAYRLLGDNELAEDCVAETFCRFLTAVRSGRSFENLRAYLYRIAHNWITDYCRCQLPANIDLIENLRQDQEDNPAHIHTRNQDRERIRTAIHCLPREQRRVLELRYLEEWSHTKVASALGKTVEATRSLQYRAMEALRQMLIE